jgi:hypothetical protein
MEVDNVEKAIVYMKTALHSFGSTSFPQMTIPQTTIPQMTIPTNNYFPNDYSPNDYSPNNYSPNDFLSNNHPRACKPQLASTVGQPRAQLGPK